MKIAKTKERILGERRPLRKKNPLFWQALKELPKSKPQKTHYNPWDGLKVKIVRWPDEL